jgi:hypothetical protein
MIVRRIDENEPEIDSACESSPCHTVGTPADSVTCSPAINS